MRTSLDCLTCLIRQGLDASRLATDDVDRQASIMREVLRSAAGLDLAGSPVVTAQLVHRRVRELTGIVDPYRAVKTAHNALVGAAMPELSAMVEQAPDPLLMATRLVIAANVIDLGAYSSLAAADVLTALRGVLSEPFHGKTGAFAQALATAESVLYLTDNAGEIAADRLLIERIGPHRVTLAVRGGPVLNDATREDADDVGLSDLVEVIDNGSDAPGTVLDDCSEAFRERFQRADLIIAKGQGNYESLCDTAANIYFLFKVKCSVVGEHAGLAVGSHALLPALSSRQSSTPTGDRTVDMASARLLDCEDPS